MNPSAMQLRSPRVSECFLIVINICEQNAWFLDYTHTICSIGSCFISKEQPFVAIKVVSLNLAPFNNAA